MRHKRLLSTLVLAFTLSYSTWAISRSDDSSKPINIKADSAEINDVTGISVYRGNVKVTQGSMHLTGERVVLVVAYKKVRKIVSEGNLSTFKLTTDDGRIFHAEANKMVYNIRANEIVLTKNAKITEASNIFTSDRIVYYTDTEIVSAGSVSGSDRVSITISPETIEKEKNKGQ